ncbi:hypothetical protein GCM10010964_07030 [Caldovatus sediminis]|uniref:Uncharacterized protein n=1 Tax=Caldovatus sediminis TaxID=2041189 RepID=A0A8J2Z9C6_9PROT|nr:hypothetical protein [Caldovatus sediminis]GGG21438.1 hypothetical protein GCM10010964_07030 [Caldovatus sediminis]
MASHIFTRDHGSFSSMRQPDWLPEAIETAANDREAPPFAVAVRTAAGVEAGASLLCLPQNRGYAVLLVTAEGARRTVMFQNEGAALAFFLEQGVAFARTVAETLRAAAPAAADPAAAARRAAASAD